MSAEAIQFMPPIECAPWCTDGDGHPECFCREDQTCWGSAEYVSLSIHPVHFEKSGAFPQQLGVMARRDDQQTVVYLHLQDIRTGEGGEFLDMSLKLTPEEAERLAVELMAVAEVLR